MRIQVRHVNGVAVLAAFVVITSLSGLQSSLAGDENEARSLLKKSVEASGGQKNCAAWKTKVEEGELTVHWPGWGSPHAVAKRSVKRPDKMVLDQDFSVYDHPFFFTYYYNAGDVWAVVNLGVRQHPRYTKTMSRAMKDTGGLYYYLTECDTLFIVTDVPDDSLVVGSTVDRVGIVDNGDTILVDLDKKTHRPVREITDGGAQQVLFEAYDKAGALTVPYRLTIYQNGTLSAEYVWKKITFDEPLSDELFGESRPPSLSTG
jgi:hypothetical protein